MDLRARAGLALDDQAAAVLLDQPFDNAEAEPGAFVTAAQAFVDLAERLHGQRRLLAAQSDAAIDDRQAELGVLQAAAGDPYRLRGTAELDRIGEQVEEHLTQRVLI